MYKNTVFEQQEEDALRLKVSTPETHDFLQSESKNLALNGIRQIVFKSEDDLNLWVARKASIVRLHL